MTLAATMGCSQYRFIHSLYSLKKNSLKSVSPLSGWLGLLLFLFFLSVRSVAAETPQVKVASINLCADQLVLLLSDEEQIRSLSMLSQEEAGSYFFERARAYPVNEGHAEQILTLQPDLVIVGQYSNSHTVAMLREVGLRIETLPIANSIETVFENIASVARWVGHEDRGSEVVEKLRLRLKNLEKPREPKPLAAGYDPNGYTSGALSVRGQIMEYAGFSNVASLAGIDSYGKLSLEAIINLQPDALIESPYSPGTYSRAQAMSQHPALLAAGLDPHVIHIPSRMTVCGGPWTIDVIESLQAERLKLMGG